MEIKVLKNVLTDREREWYETANKGFTVTGDVIVIKYSNGTSISYVVFNGKYTIFNSIRDCGTHYIKANYASYTRIEKDTLEITEDVEDI